VNLAAHALPGVRHETFCTLFLHLEQIFLGLVYEFAECSVIGGANSAFNREKLSKEDGCSGQDWPL
jgi:hypothetical protein